MERGVSKRPGNFSPASQMKRPKTDDAPNRRILSSAAVENENASTLTKSPTVPVASGSEFRIQQARNFAVGQAQKDGCTGMASA